MRSLSIIQQAVIRLRLRDPPRRILELGAGDGSLLLRLARSKSREWPEVELTLLDLQNVVSAETCAEYSALGWSVTSLCTDANEWARLAPLERYDLCVTTLFLHHFQREPLALLLTAIAGSARTFIACEPSRNRISRIGSHLLGFLGVNDVTREDGVTSVAAGFNEHELSALWPSDAHWQLEEYFAWPFTHCFVARRADGSPANAVA